MLSTVLTLATWAFTLICGIDCLAVLIAACCVIDRYAFPSKVANSPQALSEHRDKPGSETRTPLSREEAAQLRIARFPVYNPAPGGGTPVPALRRSAPPEETPVLMYGLFILDDIGDASPA